MPTTTCKKCGKQVTYKTKKPDYCKECNPSKFYKKPKVPKRSKLEFQVQRWVKELFPNRPFISGGYYSWLPSPKGYPMQLDIFIYGSKGSNIAIEVDGIQHTERQYFQSQKDFDYQRECDKDKEWMCKSKGIIYIKIKDTECKSKEDFISILEKYNIEVK